jgi:hypothetical protein
LYRELNKGTSGFQLARLRSLTLLQLVQRREGQRNAALARCSVGLQEELAEDINRPVLDSDLVKKIGASDGGAFCYGDIRMRRHGCYALQFLNSCCRSF